MSDDGEKAPIERAIELAIYAPIGLALFAKDMLPPLVDQFVQRGRSEVEQLGSKVENQIGQARILGQFAVNQGGEQIRREVGTRVGEARERGEQLARTVGLRREAGGDEAAAPAPKTEAAPPAATPTSTANGNLTADHLPIPDYDELSASQVVARLSGLAEAELEAVRHYESAKRQRKTILAKIDQLTG